MTKDYKYITHQIDGMGNINSKIIFLLNCLMTHNKNLTKTQVWVLEDLLGLIKAANKDRS